MIFHEIIKNEATEKLPNVEQVNTKGEGKLRQKICNVQKDDTGD